MKLIEDLSFTWADENCLPCKDPDPLFYCEAESLIRGYEAGFKKALELAATHVSQSIAAESKYLLMPTQVAVAAISNYILTIGQEEVPQTTCVDCGVKTEPGAGSARCHKCWDDRCGGSGGDGEV